MGNYKGASRTITYGGYKRAIPAGAKIIVLCEPTNNASAADAMIKEFDNVLYQVTAGKTFHLCGLQYSLSAGGGTIVVHEGDTEDAQTTAKGTVVCGFEVGVLYEVAIIDETFASTKFITVSPSTTQVLSIRMIGYEV